MPLVAFQLESPGATAIQADVDVSIVIVHWNVPRLLDTCLRSIAAEAEHSEREVEVTVVDNNSDDKGFDQVMAGHPWAQPLKLDVNLGFGAANNLAATHATGSACLFLNPDTELLPGALDALWNALQVAPHVGATAPLLFNADGSLQSAGYRFPGPMNVLFDLFRFPLRDRLYNSAINGRMPVGDGAQPVRVDYALGAALLVRREAFMDAGGFDDDYFMYSEEVDLARRLAARGWTLLVVPVARIVHHGGQSTGQNSEAMREALWLSRARYSERWATPTAGHLTRSLVAAGTRLDDRNATPERRAVNARIRRRFGGSGGPGT